MKNNDSKQDYRELMCDGFKSNDAEKITKSFEIMNEQILEEVSEKIENATAERDANILQMRGVRQLTSEEKKYYEKLADCIKSDNPKQALANTSLVMPTTVVNAVFDELQNRHPLLQKIQFAYTGGAIQVLMNSNGYQTAAWGTLCAEIVKELTAGFKEVKTNLLKLSAFLPVCKATLELGYEWLDSYVRQVLYEALANGLEAGIIAGDGNETPIGMIRQVGADVAVVGGAYPKKDVIAVNDLQPATLGHLISMLAVDDNGKSREVRDLIMVVNPYDYFSLIMPATTVLAPDGTYRNNVLPYPIEIIQSPAVDVGEAVLGLGYKYFAAASMPKEGRIEYSDHAAFVEDQRLYLIKLYANGFPMDNNAFLRLDISGLQPAWLRVESVTVTPSSDATLANLKIGALTLSPAFDADEDTYTATTTNASNVITAIPADAGAKVAIAVGGNPIVNGTAATWAAGANTLTVTVTAADGSTTETYTVTVTKS